MFFIFFVISFIFNILYHLGNCHIYDDHIDVLQEQSNREPFEFPKINIKNRHENINDYCLGDIDIIGYTSHKSINMKMRK